ncbi:MAG TPA: carbonic anhydrase [Stellaceae bacterium]|nr:carbonic anhydrase [Stellaceae bacterium]
MVRATRHEAGDHPDCGGHTQMADDSPRWDDREPSRRRLLRAGVAGTAAGALSGAGLADPGTALAQNPATPDAALQALLDGNRRYVAGKPTSLTTDLALARAKTVHKQQPFAAVLSCADSRVPVEWIFDAVIGRIFVTRVAGNIATPENIASLEFGARFLGAKAILVLGHDGCGAVKAALDLTATPGQISGLYSYIRPAIDQARATTLAPAIMANAKFQAALLRESSPLLRQLIAKGELKIAAGIYDLATGRVELLA